MIKFMATTLLKNFSYIKKPPSTSLGRFLLFCDSVSFAIKKVVF
jgi:hypothetical protein